MDLSGDLADAATAEALVPQAREKLGHLDVLVCNHAHGGDPVTLDDLTAAALDRHWAVNTRATLLLTKAFAAQHDGRKGGRVIWMTSGQMLGPMSDNLAYAVSKAALAGSTWSVADHLVEKGILLNTDEAGRVIRFAKVASAADPAVRSADVRASTLDAWSLKICASPCTTGSGEVRFLQRTSCPTTLEWRRRT